MSTDRNFLPGQGIRGAGPRPAFGPIAPDSVSTGPGIPGREPDLPLQPSTWSIQATLAALLSFEFLFVLFLAAGRIKASAYLAWMPVDLTGTLFALSVVAGAFMILTKEVNLRGIMIATAMAAFVTWLIVSLLWTPGVAYAQEKVLSSLLALWACAGAAIIIATDRARVRRFLTLLVLFAVWYAIEGAFAYAAAENRWYVEVLGTNYGILGNSVAHGAVIVIATLISLRRAVALKVVLLALLVVFAFILLIAGSRHPLLGLALVLLLAVTIGFRRSSGIGLQRFQLAAMALLVLAVGTVTALILREAQTYTLGRFEILLQAEGGGKSAQGRLLGMANAVSFWQEAPVVGHGVGSFPILENYPRDARRHPHNIFLEVLCELGLVGLILFGIFLVSALRWVKLSRLRGDPLYRCVFLLAMFDFSHAMLGPDLGEHRLFYAFLGLLALPAARGMGAASPRQHAARLGTERGQLDAVGIGPGVRQEAEALDLSVRPRHHGRGRDDDAVP